MPTTPPTYIWRRLATREWVDANEPRLHVLTNGGFAIIERVGRKRLLVEVACSSRAYANRLVDAFGGRSEKLARDWLNELLRKRSTKPIRVGSRLVVISDSEEPTTDGRARLVIPAGAAFGTGEHATTAMSLRFLERVTRDLAPGWRMLDAGTGSGILALSGRHFGARSVIAVENNPLAL
ncbi:MAG TPA: 50S ribosomal protein L11 methyltransferase, partial [Chthoniobacterales bacterium]